LVRPVDWLSEIAVAALLSFKVDSGVDFYSEAVLPASSLAHALIKNPPTAARMAIVTMIVFCIVFLFFSQVRSTLTLFMSFYVIIYDEL